MPWDDDHDLDHIEQLEHAEIRMLRLLLDMQVAQGRLLIQILDQQESNMVDIATLTASLEEVKASAETASTAVLTALDATSAQIADLTAQIEALSAGQITQEQIDALAQTAADTDAIIDSITAAVSPASPEA